MPFGPNDPFKDFFERFFRDQIPKDFRQQSLGTGLIIDKEGFILTNNHVVETADEIKRDFDRLFPYPEGKLPPIESFFLTLENSSHADEVSAYYASAGLTIDEEFELIPDHLYLELLFMSYLIETNRYDLQKKFLDEHLMNWIPYYWTIDQTGRTVYCDSRNNLISSSLNLKKRLNKEI
jgi:TorA maturation chaperone TorD